MKLKEELGFGVAGAGTAATGAAGLVLVIVSRVVSIQSGFGFGPIGSKRG